MQVYRKILHLITFLFVLALSSCASLPERPNGELAIAYSTYEDTSLEKQFAPVFIIENAAIAYNRIGTPVAKFAGGKEKITIDPDTATFYTSKRTFKTEKESYTNLIYRIHFQEIPFSIIPFHLGAGENVGLLAVVTLNSLNQPVLYSFMHTCGCYLAFVPTSYLPEEDLPDGWQKGRQNVFGEYLPAHLSYSSTEEKEMLYVQLRQEKHRVKDVWLGRAQELSGYQAIKPELQPFSALENLTLPNGQHTSFYETSGLRKDYVKGSHKIWERLLISWWSLDWRIGEDKKLGRDTDDGIVFYTSIKPWAREESDLRDFPRFLKYWGWKL